MVNPNPILCHLLAHSQTLVLLLDEFKYASLGPSRILHSHKMYLCSEAKMWPPLTRDCEKHGSCESLGTLGERKGESCYYPSYNHYNHHLRAILSAKSGVLPDSVC